MGNRCTLFVFKTFLFFLLSGAPVVGYTYGVLLYPQWDKSSRVFSERLANGHPLGFLTPYRQNDATYTQSKLP